MPDFKAFKPKIVKPINHDQQLCGIRFSPDGKMLVGGTFVGTVRRWDTATDTYSLLPSLTGHNGWVQCVAFHPDGKRLITADSWGTIACWPYADQEPKAHWVVKEAHSAWVHALAVSPDGKWIVSAGRDQTIRLSSPETGSKIAQWSAGEDVLSLAFQPDGKSFLTGDLKGVIKHWDIATHKLLRELNAKEMFLRDRIQDVGGVRCFAFNGDSSKLFAGGSQPKSGGFVEGRHLLYVYDWKSGKVEHTYKSTADADGYILDMTWHKDGYLMAVTSGQPGQGKLLCMLPGETMPFFALALPNAHSLTLHPKNVRLVVSATNANSAGNGRPMSKEKDYPGNTSPLHLFDLPT
jgi:WD40 repeat protein